MSISGYHSSIKKKIVSPLKPSLPSMNLDAEWGKVKLVEILKMYCLQDSTKKRPPKFKGSYLQEFYTQVAKDNGYFKRIVKKEIIIKSYLMVPKVIKY